MYVNQQDRERIKRLTISTNLRVTCSVIAIILIIAFYPYYYVRNEAFYVEVAAAIFGLFVYTGISISATFWYRNNRFDPVASELYSKRPLRHSVILEISKRFIIKEWV